MTQPASSSASQLQYSPPVPMSLGLGSAPPAELFPVLPPAPILAASVPQYALPTKFIVVTCRALTSDESQVFANNFKHIITYNAALSSSFDLTKMNFDLLIIDASNEAS